MTNDTRSVGRALSALYYSAQNLSRLDASSLLPLRDAVAAVNSYDVLLPVAAGAVCVASDAAAELRNMDGVLVYLQQERLQALGTTLTASIASVQALRQRYSNLTSLLGTISAAVRGSDGSIVFSRSKSAAEKAATALAGPISTWFTSWNGFVADVLTPAKSDALLLGLSTTGDALSASVNAYSSIRTTAEAAAGMLGPLSEGLSTVNDWVSTKKPIGSTVSVLLDVGSVALGQVPLVKTLIDTGQKVIAGGRECSELLSRTTASIHELQSAARSLPSLSAELTGVSVTAELVSGLQTQMESWFRNTAPFSRLASTFVDAPVPHYVDAMLVVRVGATYQVHASKAVPALLHC